MIGHLALELLTLVTFCPLVLSDSEWPSVYGVSIWNPDLLVGTWYEVSRNPDIFESANRKIAKINVEFNDSEKRFFICFFVSFVICIFLQQILWR